jgi:NTP pyrophosphatase (non-canonical NTP hydrolase)
MSVTMVAVTTFAEFQEVIEATYGTRDRARGQAATVAWLCEEVGELAKAARKGTREEQLHELSDVVAWVASLANQLDLSIEEAITRYTHGCPRCQGVPCSCP